MTSMSSSPSRSPEKPPRVIMSRGLTDDSLPDLEQKSKRVSTNSSNGASSIHEAPSPSLSTNDSMAESVGMVAAGWAWVDRQRNRRRRQYLQHQAERQMQKIAEAERLRQQQQDVHRLSDNTTFQNIVGSQQQDGSSQNNGIERTASDEIRMNSELSKSGEGATVHLDLSVLEAEDQLLLTPKVRVEEESPGAPKLILNESQMQEIAIHLLPRTVSYSRWKRLYSLSRDGDSFHSFLRIVDNVQRTLMVIKTTRGEIFGGYVGSPWQSHDQMNSKFYGSADAGLFRFVGPKSEKLEVFKWSGANRYIQLCETSNKMLALGGGGQDGSFGLCVQEDFQLGSTGPCDTFNNEPLCSQENFRVLELEVFEFLTGVF